MRATRIDKKVQLCRAVQHVRPHITRILLLGQQCILHHILLGWSNQGGWQWLGRVVRIGRVKNAHNFSCKTWRQRHLGMDGKIILKWMWIEFIWLRIGSSGWLLWQWTYGFLLTGDECLCVFFVTAYDQAVSLEVSVRRAGKVLKQQRRNHLTMRNLGNALLEGLIDWSVDSWYI
jgi:hypothetical protein